MTENDIQTLLKDGECNDAIAKTFFMMHHKLFALSVDTEKPYGGPIEHKLSEVRKILAPHFERINEKQRQARLAGKKQ